MYQVYKYTFPNGKIYIGVTSQSIQARRDCGYNHNKDLKEAHRKYGWKNVATDILYRTTSQEDAFEKEMLYINQYDAINPEIGYNISPGGKSTYAGLKHTDDYRQHMSNIFKDRTFSEATLRKMKASHAKERKAVVCYDEYGAEVARFESLHQAAAAFNSHPTNIARACKRDNPYRELHWEFLDNEGRRFG